MKALLMSPKSGGGGAKSPHCKVCGDESSGFHYGVDSCEGCKGFFRRCITQGMTHKCANEEKCEITPFTRNSCQYCRLKKCFQVGMSREASRLGRRPKRLKDVSGEGRRSQMTNLPIAPHPSPQELQRMNSEELQRIISNLKPEDMQAWMSKAQQSFREHSKSGQATASSSSSSSAPTSSIATPSLSSPSSSHVTSSTPAGLDAKNMGAASASAALANSNNILKTIAVSSTSALSSLSPATSTVAVVSPSSASSNLSTTGQQQQHPGLVYMNGGIIKTEAGGTAYLGNGNINLLGSGNGNIASPAGLGAGGVSSSGSGVGIDNFLGSAPPSPFNDLGLGLAELSPVDPNMAAAAFGGQSLYGGGGGSGKSTPGGKLMANNNISTNNNSAYSPDSPLVFPGSDQVELAISPSAFMNFNPASQASGGGGSVSDPLSPGAFIMSMPNSVGAVESVGSPLDSKAGIVLGMSSTAGNSAVVGETSPTTSHTGAGMISPEAIKQEYSPGVVSVPPQEGDAFYVDHRDNSLADVDKVLAEVKEVPSEKRRLLIDQITDAIIQAHMTTTLNTQDNIRKANDRISREQGTMSMMPHMPMMDMMEPKLMWSQFFNSMVPEITKVIKFSKKLPGFTEIDMEDQQRLIKQGCFEVMIARITLLVDHVNETMIDPSLKMKSTRSVIRNMPPFGPFLDEFFEIAKLINPLNMTDGENGLFTAILMICPDRKGLENINAVNTIQQIYLQALYLLMRHNHKDADETFCSLISSVPEIRKVNDHHFLSLNNMKMNPGAQFEDFPALHRELFDVEMH